MKHEVITYSKTDEEILSQFDLIRGIYRSEFTKTPDLPISEIQKICADAWAAPVSAFIGKINHNNDLDKKRKFSFLFACYYFSNEDTDAIAKYIGCRWNTVNRSNNTIFCEIKWKWKYARICLDIVKSLMQRCKDRLDNLAKVDFSMIKGVDSEIDWSLRKLDPYQIACITIKAIDWFYNDNNSFSMMAYSLDAKTYKYIRFSRTSDHILLHRMQHQGYRFISWDSGEHKEITKRNAICDRCLKKNNCGLRDSTYSIGGFVDKKFDCFEELPGVPLRVDMNLLLPLPKFRLQ